MRFKTNRATLFVAGVFVIAVVYGPAYTKYRDLKLRHQAIQEELEKVRVEVEALRRENYLLENDVHHLEHVVREELGLARPGEEVYRFTKPLKESLPKDAAAQELKVEKKESNAAAPAKP